MLRSSARAIGDGSLRNPRANDVMTGQDGQVGGRRQNDTRAVPTREIRASPTLTPIDILRRQPIFNGPRALFESAPSLTNSEEGTLTKWLTTTINPVTSAAKNRSETRLRGRGRRTQGSRCTSRAGGGSSSAGKAPQPPRRGPCSGRKIRLPRSRQSVKPRASCSTRRSARWWRRWSAILSVP